MVRLLLPVVNGDVEACDFHAQHNEHQHLDPASTLSLLHSRLRSNSGHSFVSCTVLPKIVACSRLTHTVASLIRIRFALVNMRSLYSITFLAAVASAQYELQSTLSGETFFDNFVFFNSWDPTYGFVQYVSKKAAQGFGMINATNTSASWGVDTTGIFDPAAPLGRPSIRITTIESWTHGLFIADLAHMPANVCGTWPAFWALGSGTWPDNGTKNRI